MAESRVITAERGSEHTAVQRGRPRPPDRSAPHAGEQGGRDARPEQPRQPRDPSQTDGQAPRSAHPHPSRRAAPGTQQGRAVLSSSLQQQGQDAQEQADAQPGAEHPEAPVRERGDDVTQPQETEITGQGVLDGGLTQGGRGEARPVGGPEWPRTWRPATSQASTRSAVSRMTRPKSLIVPPPRSAAGRARRGRRGCR